MKKTCKNCNFESAPNKCIRSNNGGMFNYYEVNPNPGRHDEYDYCGYWEPLEANGGYVLCQNLSHIK